MEPHAAEVFSRAPLALDTAPADVADRECAAGFLQYTGRSVDGSPQPLTGSAHPRFALRLSGYQSQTATERGSPMNSTPRTAFVLFGGALLTVLAVGCGGGDKGDSTSTSTTPTTSTSTVTSTDTPTTTAPGATATVPGEGPGAGAGPGGASASVPGGGGAGAGPGGASAEVPGGTGAGAGPGGASASVPGLPPVHVP